MRLFLTSTTLLFVELLVIRWIPANVVYVSYFSNFLLMSSFLGIGLGILMGRAGSRLAISPFTLLLFGLVALVLRAQLNIDFQPGDQVFHGLNPNSADTNFVVLPLLMLLVVALMTALALPLGDLLRAMPPLQAYAIDIAGSLTGIAVFAIISLLGLPPLAWFAITAALLSALALGRGITAWSAVPAASMLGALLLIWRAGTGAEVWSPYYRITAFDANGAVALDAPPTGGSIVQLFLNGVPHQSMVAADFSSELPLYGEVYRWFPDRRFANVLIVGAGSGTDVALALARNAEHIDAVEIDPRIAEIGKVFHPDRPYDDPRVSIHADDGRAFLRRTDTKYDLILFALTDSLTLVSSTGNVRLESFLFTEEALAGARDHLAQDGVFVMYNYYREPWLVAKLDAMAASVFGYEPILRLDPRGSRAAVIAAGPGVVAATTSGSLGDSVDPPPAVDGTPPTPARDDWPFLYLRSPSIPSYYLGALAALLAFALAAVATASRVTRIPLRRGFSPHFFALGVAFLLLETRSLVTFSLLFGTTWLVNALVFFAILSSVLGAIGISARFTIHRPALLYLALFATLALAWLLPPQQLLIDPPALRYVVAGALAFAPILLANLVFAHSFRETSMADMSFASNLLGAMVGGTLEYLALLTGYQSLLLVIAGLYALAYLFATRWRFLADRQLHVAGLEKLHGAASSPVT